MRLKDLEVYDLYDLMDELDRMLAAYDFNEKPKNYRIGVRRMRNYLDHVASGLRMIQGGPIEEHNITAIHFHKREYYDRT